MIYNNLLIHENIYDELLSKVSNKKISNAYIFHGQEGTGKEAHAIEFFASLNCNNNTECSDCSSCNKVKTLQHELLNIILPLPKNKTINKKDSALKTLDNKQLDLLTKEFELKGKNPYHKIKIKNANTILINSINDIKKSISLSIPKNKFKLHLILDSDKLCFPRQEAGNALLKILEEPPENNFFILITSDISKILDTIKSRCNIISFNSISYKKHYNYLIENNIENSVAKIASKISLGDINYSLKLSKEFKTTISNLEQIIKSLLRSDLLEWEKIFNKIKNKNDIIDLVKLLNIFFNDVCKFKNNLKNISFTNFEKYMESLSTNYFLDHEKFDFITNETIKNINLNGYLPLITTGLYIELDKIIKNKF